jgi:hypothetical protein
MIDPNKVHVARSVGLFCLYSFIFWRTFRDNPGNRVIQCGSHTLMLFLVMLALTQIPQVPFDYVAWFWPALFLKSASLHQFEIQVLPPSSGQRCIT